MMNEIIRCIGCFAIGAGFIMIFVDKIYNDRFSYEAIMTFGIGIILLVLSFFIPQ